MSKAKGKYPFSRGQHGGRSERRAMRRDYMRRNYILAGVKALRNGPKKDYYEYLRDSAAQGKQHHNEFIEEVMRNQKEALSEKESSMRNHFKEFGYSKKKIDEIVKAWKKKHL